MVTLIHSTDFLNQFVMARVREMEVLLSAGVVSKFVANLLFIFGEFPVNDQ